MRVGYLTITSFAVGKHRYGQLTVVADNSELDEPEKHDVTTEVSRAQAKRLNRNHGRGDNPFSPGDETTRIETYETVVEEGKKLARDNDLDVLFEGRPTEIYPEEVLIGPNWLRYQHRKAGKESTEGIECSYERWDRVRAHLLQNEDHPELEETPTRLRIVWEDERDREDYEDYENPDIDEPYAFGEKLIEFFNHTTREGEAQRTLLRVKVGDDITDGEYDAPFGEQGVFSADNVLQWQDPERPDPHPRARVLGE